MCLTCGCLQPNVCHHFNVDGSCADILLSDLEEAAGAAGVGTSEAANNIPRTLRQATGQGPEESFSAMLERPQLVFDIDNTLADLSRAVCVGLNSYFVSDYTIDDFDTYQWADVVTPAQAEWIQEELDSGRLYPNLSPIAGGISCIQRAVAAGYTVTLLTDRLESTRDVTNDWLDDNDVPSVPLIMKQDGRTKLAALQEMVADPEEGFTGFVVIDDNPEVLRGVNHLGGQAWTLKWPYSPSDPGIRVFDNWHEPKRWLGI